MSILQFNKKKQSGEKLALVTCYDYWSATILNQCDIDGVLVGDSGAMVMHGYETTIPATLDMIVAHTAAVARGLRDKFIIADLPFLTYRKALSENMEAVAAVMQAGAHAVKLEGLNGNEELIQHIVESGVPVMGHLGLTPQFYHQLGGYRVQGRDLDSHERILNSAKRLAELGCFSVVLECVPSALGSQITREVPIVTIGIGAGPDTDGQILVLHDLLGLSPTRKAKFVRQFMQGRDLVRDAVQAYTHEVRGGTFPGLEESYE